MFGDDLNTRSGFWMRRPIFLTEIESNCIRLFKAEEFGEETFSPLFRAASFPV
jgi:hypothetical protein